MRALPYQSPSVSQAAQWGPALIGPGLVILLAATRWSMVPEITGMALVALGATGATTNRLRGAAAFHALVAIHLFVYLSLYLMFLGAVFHAASADTPDGFTFVRGLDVVASALTMTLVVRLSLAALVGGGDAPTR